MIETRRTGLTGGDGTGPAGRRTVPGVSGRTDRSFADRAFVERTGAERAAAERIGAERIGAGRWKPAAGANRASGFWASDEGHWLVEEIRFPRDEDGTRDTAEAFLDSVGACWAELDDQARARLFHALAPADGEVARHSVLDVLPLAGQPVRIVRVELPLTLIALVRQGRFDGGPLEAEARGLLQRSENHLLALPLDRSPDIFMLGRRTGGGGGMLPAGAWEILADSDADPEPLRRARRIATHRRLGGRAGLSRMGRAMLDGLYRCWHLI